jgi:hypothetical protein
MLKKKKTMELLIVLGLSFGAYELLGVFQGCFQYNEHPFPYQPNQSFDSQKSTDEQEPEEKQSNSDDESQAKKSGENSAKPNLITARKASIV